MTAKIHVLVFRVVTGGRRKIFGETLCPHPLQAKVLSHLLSHPLNAELNPICHLLALLGSHHILHVSRIRVKDCNRMELPLVA